MTTAALPQAFSNGLHFYQAAEERTGRIERFYKIAGQTLCLRFAGRALVPVVTRALAHLATAATNRPDLTICLAESQSSGVALPVLSVPSGLYSAEEGRLYICHYAAWQWQEFLALHERMGILAIGAAENYPPFARAAPLRNLLTWWLVQQGLYGLHAAAVGTPDAGALIVGDGGAGKSTTAITCLQAGLTYLSDDFCILAFDSEPQIHTLYSTGKLSADSRQWLAPEASTVDSVCADGKTVYQWYPHYQAQLPSTLPIRALFLPCVHGALHTRVYPAKPTEAFTTVATTAFRVMSLPNRVPQQLLTEVKRLVQAVPTYHLALGTDRAEIPAAILQVLAHTESRG